MKIVFVPKEGDKELDWRIPAFYKHENVPQTWMDNYHRIGGHLNGLERPSPETNLAVLRWWAENINED